MQHVLFSYIYLINIVQATLIANNAQVWPPTLLGYLFNEDHTNCSNRIFEDYDILGVGQNNTGKGDYICLSNSPIGLMWSPPQIFNVSQFLSIILEAKIINHELVLWYNITA